jgi:hypothetical protein
MKYILRYKEANQQLLFIQETACNRKGVFFLKWPPGFSYIGPLAQSPI